MPTNMCVICGSKWLARKSNRSFFKIPNLDSAQLSDTDKSFLKRRREAWLGLIGEKFKKYNGKSSAHVCVCSDHFHSGKPSYLYMDHDIDWVPSINLEGLGILPNTTISKQTADHCFLATSNDNASKLSNGAPLIEPPPEPYKPPDKCCVGICGKVRGPGTVLFRFPDASKYPLLNQPAVARRRDAWLNAVGWTELVIQQNPPTLYICSDHFQGKKPAPLICENHVDWKPTLLLGDPISAKQGDIDPLNFVEIKQEMMDDLPQLPSDATDSLEVDSSTSEEFEIISFEVDSPTPEALEISNLKSQLDEKTIQLNEKDLALEEKSAQLTEKSLALEKSLLELKALKHKLADAELSLKQQLKQTQQDRFINDLRNNDKLTKFYTGLQSWSLFTTVFNAVYQPNYDSSDSRSVLSKQQEFLMSLMRLRLNLLITDLAHRFNTSHSKADMICKRGVDLIFYQLPASNIGGTGLAQQWGNGERNVEEKLRKNLKRTFSLLGDTSPTNELHIEDEVGFPFIYKATYVCDYLMKMNSDTVEPPTLSFNND